MKTRFLPLIGFLLITLLAGCGSEKEKTYQGDLHYTLTGQGDTTLVFVHGWGINGEYWSNQAEEFKGSYKILTLDLPGHGKSPLKGDTISIDAYGEAVADLIRQLDLSNVILIGHSMSGNVNLHVYAKVTDRVIGFIGVDNLQVVGYRLSPEEKKQALTFFDQFKTDYKNTVKGYALTYLFHAETDTIVKARVINDITRLNPVLSEHLMKTLVLNEPAYEREVIPKLKMSLLLIVSEGTIHDESSLQTYCKQGYKYWTTAGTGHYPMIEKPEAFNARLKEALALIAAGEVNL